MPYIQPSEATSPQPHLNAQACVINCIDYRIQEPFYHYLEKHHLLGKTDIIEVAGSSRDLVKPLKPQDQQELLQNIQISVKLHSPKKLLIFDHQDCGGYAQDQTIPQGLTLDQDKQQHSQYLLQAKNLLKNLFPNLEIHTYYITLNHEICLL